MHNFQVEMGNDAYIHGNISLVETKKEEEKEKENTPQNPKNVLVLKIRSFYVAIFFKKVT